MDPIANLKEQLNSAREIERTWDNCADNGDLAQCDLVRLGYLAARLAELVLALDEWTRTGGFSPYAKSAEVSK